VDRVLAAGLSVRGCTGGQTGAAPARRRTFAAVHSLDRTTRGGIIGAVSEPAAARGPPVPGSGPSENGHHRNSDHANASYWHLTSVINRG